MNIYFADTFYWVASINPNDNEHNRITTFNLSHKPFHMITSEEVIFEVLNNFSKAGEHLHQLATKDIREIYKKKNTRVIPISRERYLKGFTLYESRKDKEYSITDCMSMLIMKEMNLSTVLTQDHHFEQEGFQITFPKPKK